MDNQPKLLSREEYEHFLSSLPKNTCTFCHYEKYQIILKEGWRWIWIANLSPYWYWHTMLIPKRHFTDFVEMDDFEAIEFREMLTHAMKRYRSADLKRVDGTDVKKYVYFWRKRDDLIDPISGNKRPDHFHVHIAPDKDHLWDPILDEDAYKLDLVKTLGEKHE